MKVTVSRQQQTSDSVDVEFPLYSRWIASDTCDVLNRVEENGSCITIKKDIGDYREKFESPSFELEFTKISIDPLQACYLDDQTFGRGRTSIADEFRQTLTEMKAAVEAAIAVVAGEAKP